MPKNNSAGNQPDQSGRESEEKPEAGPPPTSQEMLLRILAGPHRGTRAPVRNGLVIGRKDGDLLIKDPKISIRHAEIVWRDSEWLLVDLGSANKIKVEGNRYEEVVLYPGLKITIGSTPIEILEKPRPVVTTQEKDFDFSSSIEVHIEPEAAEESVSWREMLSTTLTRLQALPVPPSTKRIKPFSHLLRLEFISGVQSGTSWTLGYGPREVGVSSFDLPLYDDAASDSSFIIDTQGGNITLQAKPESKLFLNGKLASTDPTPLRSGDRVEIGKTRIRVLLED